MTAQLKILVSQWVEKAENDLRAATIIAGEESPPTDTVCFHCQQTAEKYLKAYLITRGSGLVRTHDLVYLVGLCSKFNKKFNTLMDAAVTLNKYYIEGRYPADIPTYYSLNEAQTAVDCAHQFKKIVRKALSLP